VTILLLIRHGENDLAKRGVLAGRRAGVHLNDRGRKQAEELGRALGGLPIRALYSSPLERAMETAAPIAKALGLRIQRAPGLIETDVGHWEGKSVRRLALTKYWRIVQGSPSRAGHPGGETFMEVQLRIVAALETICARHQPRHMVACVLHSDPIKLAVAHFLGLPLDNFQRLTCDPASVTMLVVTPGNARLVWLNRQPPFELPKASAGR
jgi:probable phosphomutase (TIGR03848 family)